MVIVHKVRESISAQTVESCFNGVTFFLNQKRIGVVQLKENKAVGAFKLSNIE